MIIVIGGGDIGRAIAKAFDGLLFSHKDLDVTDYKQVKQLYFKDEDVIVNCAGIYGPIGQFHNNGLKQWHKTINVNLLGTVNVCYAVLKKMKIGKIINFSGGGALYPRPNFSAYATSKAAVVRFTETIAQEYPNIQINCIAPGFIRTKMTKNVEKGRESQSMDKVIKAVKFIINSNVTGAIVNAQSL